jgi:DNA-nicking Smr family endonuclease
MPDKNLFHSENNPFRRLDAKRFPSGVKDVPRRPLKRLFTENTKKSDAARLANSETMPEVEYQDETSLFFDAVGAVHFLRRRGRDVAVSPEVGIIVPPCEEPEESCLQKFMEGKLEFRFSMTDEYQEGYVVGLDPLILNKLRAGAFNPEGHLDMHGLNAVQAFDALRGFVRAAWFKGMRTLLVVPGRGRNSPHGMGVLREKLSAWLTQEPFKRVVLAFCTAQSYDGGLGGFYVLLRKYRKKGRVCWERMPADPDLF